MRRRSSALLGALLASCCAITQTACQFTGPATIRVGRGSYNAAVQQTNNEQLLLNIVRLRYRDNPFFLEVASVSTSFIFAANLDGDVEIPSGAPDTFGLGTGVGVSEEPTVTYTPLQGDQFVKQLLSPIDPSMILLLYHSGWSISRILQICVERLGELSNAPSASGPTPRAEPRFERFLRAVDLLRELQVQGALQLGQSSDPEQPGLVLRIGPTGRGGAAAREFAELMGSEEARSEYRFVQDEGEPGTIALRTRSLMAALFYASQGIDVPPKHEEAGWVTVTQRATGEVFDWSRLTGELLNVKWSWLRPRNAYVKTAYQGVWFYIDPADLHSKSTFVLLTQLFALQGGSVPGLAPLLTLPVSR